MFEKIVYRWLDNALDCGISEETFWNMTIAELIRAIESYKRRTKAAAQERAVMDYILADTIGRSVSRIYSSTSKMPTLAEVYPSLFSSEDIAEQQQQKKMELSAMRFKQFANAYNSKYKEVAANK